MSSFKGESNILTILIIVAYVLIVAIFVGPWAWREFYQQPLVKEEKDNIPVEDLNQGLTDQNTQIFMNSGLVLH